MGFYRKVGGVRNGSCGRPIFHPGPNLLYPIRAAEIDTQTYSKRSRYLAKRYLMKQSNKGKNLPLSMERSV